jgi:hypothetical protein
MGGNKKLYKEAFDRARSGKSPTLWQRLTRQFQDHYTQDSREQGEHSHAARSTILEIGRDSIGDSLANPNLQQETRQSLPVRKKKFTTSSIEADDASWAGLNELIPRITRMQREMAGAIGVYEGRLNHFSEWIAQVSVGPVESRSPQTKSHDEHGG